MTPEPASPGSGQDYSSGPEPVSPGQEADGGGRMTVKTTRIRIIYLAALVVLGVLVVLSLVHPTATEKEYSPLLKESLLKTKDGWMLQFEVANQSQEDATYRLELLVAQEKPVTYHVAIPSGRMTTLVYGLKDSELQGDGKVRVLIYRDRETTPVNDETYYLQEQEKTA